MTALHKELLTYPRKGPGSVQPLGLGRVISGSPPSAWKAKGELDAVLSMPKEGVVVPLFLFPFLKGRGQGMVVPLKANVEFSRKAPHAL